MGFLVHNWFHCRLITNIIYIYIYIYIKEDIKNENENENENENIINGIISKLNINVHFFLRINKCAIKPNTEINRILWFKKKI